MTNFYRKTYAYAKRYLDVRKHAYIEQLNRLEEQYLTVLQQQKVPNTTLKILMGPSFSIHEPCFIHDRILSLALRLRGASIIPVFCNQFQEGECNVYGGRWMGTTFTKACASCVNQSWAHWPKPYFNAQKLSPYLSTIKRQTIKGLMEKVRPQRWMQFHYDNIPFGQYSKNILVNNYMVGDYTLIEHHESLGRQHLENLLQLYFAYENLIKQIQPDRVVCNDSFYGMWAVLEAICKKGKIDFYSHWYGGRKDGWCYAYQEAAMGLNFHAPWKNFSQIALTSEVSHKIERWLHDRTHGADMVFDTASVGKHQTDIFSATTLDPVKPKALLCANVIWDCAALDKQIVFADMIDWIVKTIEWFSHHPEYELIIKPHPVEENPVIPKTVETVVTAIEKRNIVLPPNVHLLSAKINVSVYDLFKYAKVGLMHTSTVGMEMAAREIPIITTAKSPYRDFGFTYDPKNAEEYFQLLENILSGNIMPIKAQRDLAWKFIHFYQYHYYAKIGIMDYVFGQEPNILIEHIDELAPGKNAAFDYFVESILAGQPILSENRWMPES